MKIAHVIPYSITFPLSKPDGRYTWVLQLAHLQAGQGHDVTIYSNPKSLVDGVVCASITDVTNDKTANNFSLFRHALSKDHDIYHSHFDDLHYQLAHLTKKPIVFTQHWWPNEAVLEQSQKNIPNVWAVPPTEYMYDFDVQAGIHAQGFIHHGIDLNIFQRPAETIKTERVLYVGRISPEKDIPRLLSIIKKAGANLDIIGKITDKNQAYWQSIQYLIDGERICYLGIKTQAELIPYYARAKAFLFPANIHEAFGLVAIEAQACGTPVIMKRGGSRGELVANGKTGFLCESDDEFVQAISKTGDLSPQDCVNFAAQFDIKDMAHRYEQLYVSVMKDYAS